MRRPSRARAPFGRLVAPECPAYDDACAADYITGQDADRVAEAACYVAPRQPVLPRAWERYLRADELENDQPLRLAISRALYAHRKNARVVWEHQAGETTTAQEAVTRE
jgi:hypothetical protein